MIPQITLLIFYIGKVTLCIFTLVPEISFYDILINEIFAISHVFSKNPSVNWCFDYIYLHIRTNGVFFVIDILTFWLKNNVL